MMHHTLEAMQRQDTGNPSTNETHYQDAQHKKVKAHSTMYSAAVNTLRIVWAWFG